MNRLKSIIVLLVIVCAFVGCNDSKLIDSNTNIEGNNWTYEKSIREVVKIENPSQPYQLYFKLRHTTDYRYSNLFVLLRLKGVGLNKTIRYQFKLAKVDGEWLGKGSGDLYAHQFPLLNNFHFPKAGTYTLEIEQNMRDNPLIGVSDVGLTVVKEFD